MTERMALSVREAAETLGVGKDLVYRAIERGELRSVRLGGRVMVPRIELERLLGMETSPRPDPIEVAQELVRLLGVQDEPRLRPVGA